METDEVRNVTGNSILNNQTIEIALHPNAHCTARSDMKELLREYITRIERKKKKK